MNLSVSYDELHEAASLVMKSAMNKHNALIEGNENLMMVFGEIEYGQIRVLNALTNGNWSVLTSINSNGELTGGIVIDDGYGIFSFSEEELEQLNKL